MGEATEVAGASLTTTAAAAPSTTAASAAVLDAAVRLLSNPKFHDVTFQCIDDDARVSANRSFLMVRQHYQQPAAIAVRLHHCQHSGTQ